MLRTLRWMVLSGLLVFTATLADAPERDVRIAQAWARATPPNASVGAAFMTLTAVNDDHLLGASSTVAQRVELHTMNMDGGAMRMRPLNELALPARQPVTLSPTGTHLMLMELKHPLQAGTQFTLQLRFERAGKRNITVRVLAPAQQP